MMFASCKNNSEQKENQAANNTITPSDKISDMSIYNLPSIWTGQNGKEIELKELKGNVLVMVMFYTSCKIACPRLVADMRNIEKQVPREEKDNVKFILVKVQFFYEK